MPRGDDETVSSRVDSGSSRLSPLGNCLVEIVVLSEGALAKSREVSLLKARAHLIVARIALEVGIPATITAVKCPVLERHITDAAECPILRGARPCCPSAWDGRAIMPPMLEQMAQGALIAVEAPTAKRIDD